MKCWAKRTRLETAMLLILCASVPFLLAMIALYIFCLLQDDSEILDCNEYCRAHPAVYLERSSTGTQLGNDGTTLATSITGTDAGAQTDAVVTASDAAEVIARNFLITLATTVATITNAFENNSGQLRSQQVKAGKSLTYLAAVLHNYYIDDDTYKQYLCSGAIITPNRVLTSAACFQREGNDYIDAEDLFVRVGSDFWSKGGWTTTGKRIDLSSDQQLGLLLVEEPFQYSKTVQPIKLKKWLSNFRIDSVTMVTWKATEDQPLKYRQKYVPGSWTQLQECGDDVVTEEDVVCADEKEEAVICTNDVGSLLTDSVYLYGVQVDEVCFGKGKIRHMYKNVGYYLQWIMGLAPDAIV